MKKLYFFILIFILFQKIFSLEKDAFFISPEKWIVANPKLYSKLIQIAFVKNEKSTCRPTINLASQKTSLTLDEYTKEAVKTHLKDPQTTCRILDKIDLSQGKASICLINKNTNSVDFEILQMIFIQDEHAYILTGACKKEKMLDNYQTFMKVFSSFRLVDDLFSLISDKTKKDELIAKANNLSIILKTTNKKQTNKNIELFEKYLDKKFANLGKYFQLLLIKKAYENKGMLK